MKIVSMEQIVGVLQRLKPGARAVASGNFSAPLPLIAALDGAQETYTLHMLNAQGKLPDRPGVTLETTFVGPAMRNRRELEYFPCRLSMVPLLFAHRLLPDLVLLHTSRIVDGQVSLGLEVNVLPAAIEAVRGSGGLVIGMINPNMPYVYGDGEMLLREFDYLVEVEEPLAAVATAPPDDISLAIGENVAKMIDDGATLQLGIGSVPDAVLASLLNHQELSVWSEMFSDGVLALERAGAMSQERPIVSSFVFGSAELYQWVDLNPRVRLLRTETTNDPATIERRPLMTSVNAALQVDLFGQANASRVRGRIFSGFGGQTDFIVGAMHAPGGQAFIALPSWHTKSDTSTIVPTLGFTVTSFQQSAVVTEQGVAHLWGLSQNQQAAQLIESAAHPDARQELWSAAAELGLT